MAATVLLGAGACVSSQGCPDGQRDAGGVCTTVGDAGPAATTMTGNDDSILSVAERDAGGMDAGRVTMPDAADTADAALDAEVQAPVDAGPCDGGATTTCFDDEDEDGFAPIGAHESISCKSSCRSGTTTRKPTQAVRDCRPKDPNAHPDATDVCNDRDDDCDGSTDEGASSTCELDHAQGACVGGVCKIGECELGYDDCDGDKATGCEQALNVEDHCGLCAKTCHALASCDDTEPLGDCACVAPHFGDGDACTVIDAAGAGYAHTCAIKADHKVSCWGHDGYDQSSPPSGTFTQLAAGTNQNCALRTDGSIACWGESATGAPAAGSYIQVVTGGGHGCALLSDHTSVCWGMNALGQTATPGGMFRQLAAGATHTCGLREDGGAACWGAGTGSNCTPPECAQSNPPDAATHKFVQITNGYMHTCALKDNGTVLCWGAGTTDTNVYPHYGQSMSPPGVEFTYLSAGWFHTCGVTTAGSIVCWGAGDYDGTDNAYHKRQAFAPAGTFLRVYAGAFHTCALTSTLAMKCWGDNGEGQAPASVPGTWPLVP